MTRTWFVGRHAGAVAWARAHGLSAATFVDHLDADAVGRGDIVVGTLPMHIAAAVCARGARFVFLAMETPPRARGREFSAPDMRRFAARLVEYEVRECGPFALAPADGGT